MNRILPLAVAGTLFVGLLLPSAVAAPRTPDSAPADAKPPKSKDEELISEGMKTLHKGDNSLIKRVLAGEGSDEDIQKLQTFYHLLPAARPPLGQDDSWKDKSAALIKAIDAVAAKDPNGLAQLKEATDCKACHKIHKPK